MNVNCATKSGQQTVLFLAVENEATPILDLSTCLDLNLIKRANEVKLQAISESDPLSVLKQFPSLLKGLGQYPELTDIRVRAGAYQIPRPPRKIPSKLHDRVKSKLDELENLGVVSTNVGNVDWYNDLVIVEKRDGSIRICLDPFELNKVIIRRPCYVPTRYLFI